MRPVYFRVRARVPRALYLNFLASREFAAALAPDCFEPLRLEDQPERTLFSILVFELEGARPLWVPKWCGALAPRIIQSNWRFYGSVRGLPEGEQAAVLFWRTLTDSRLLAFWGLHLGRFLPVERARRLELWRQDEEVHAGAEPGLEFSGSVATGGSVPAPFRGRFGSFEEFARSVMEQRRAVTVWPREVVVQELHLGFETARIHPLEPRRVEVAGAEEFLENPARPLASFLVEEMEVRLEAVRSYPRAKTQ